MVAHENASHSCWCCFLAKPKNEFQITKYQRAANAKLMLDAPLGQTLFFLVYFFPWVVWLLVWKWKGTAEICCILFVQKLDKKYDGQSTTKPCQRHRFRFFVVDLIAKFLHCTLNKISSKNSFNFGLAHFLEFEDIKKMTEQTYIWGYLLSCYLNGINPNVHYLPSSLLDNFLSNFNHCAHFTVRFTGGGTCYIKKGKK